MVILCLFVFEKVAMTDLDDMMIRKTRGKPDRVTGDEMQGLDGKMGGFFSRRIASDVPIK